MDFIYTINSIYKSSKYFITANFEESINNSEESTESEDFKDLEETEKSSNFENITANEENKKEYINDSEQYSFIPLSISLIFNQPINIIENIYIGNIYGASNWSIITNLNINHIICLNKKIENFYPNEKNIKFISMDLDKNLENLDEILNVINHTQSKINSKSNKLNNILLFSLAGNNTPCVIMVAYLIFKYNFKLKKALLYICKKVPNYNVNKKYIELLKNKYD